MKFWLICAAGVLVQVAIIVAGIPISLWHVWAGVLWIIGWMGFLYVVLPTVWVQLCRRRSVKKKNAEDPNSNGESDKEGKEEEHEGPRSNGQDRDKEPGE